MLADSTLMYIEGTQLKRTINHTVLSPTNENIEVSEDGTLFIYSFNNIIELYEISSFQKQHSWTEINGNI